MNEANLDTYRALVEYGGSCAAEAYVKALTEQNLRNEWWIRRAVEAGAPFQGDSELAGLLRVGQDVSVHGMQLGITALKLLRKIAATDCDYGGRCQAELAADFFKNSSRQ